MCLRGARCDEGVHDILWGGCDGYVEDRLRAMDACDMVRTITLSQASTYQTDACDMVYVERVVCDRVRGVVHVSRLSGVFIAKQEQNALLCIQEPVTPPMVHLDWCHFPYQGHSHSHTCNT